MPSRLAGLLRTGEQAFGDFPVLVQLVEQLQRLGAVPLESVLPRGRNESTGDRHRARDRISQGECDLEQLEQVRALVDGERARNTGRGREAGERVEDDACAGELAQQRPQEYPLVLDPLQVLCREGVPGPDETEGL